MVMKSDHYSPPGSELSISEDEEEEDSEGTEDASETDLIQQQEEFLEMKEQLYQDKLNYLKQQLQQLEAGTLPEYTKKLKKLEQAYKERSQMNHLWFEYQKEAIEKDCINDKRSALREFEEKKIELKENLMQALEEKKRTVENDRCNMEITVGMRGDSKWAYTIEAKTISTRKLRRRPNEPPPVPEKRRKTPPGQLRYLLDDEDINADLKFINKLSGKPTAKKNQAASAPVEPEINYEVRIEDGKLYFERKWFHRGQSIYFESKEIGKESAVIHAISGSEVVIRKIDDNMKIRVSLTQLQRGRYWVRKRAT